MEKQSECPFWIREDIMIEDVCIYQVVMLVENIQQSAYLAR